MPENVHGGFPDRQGAVCGDRQLALAVKGGQVTGANPYSHGPADTALLPQPRRNALTQCQQRDLDIILVNEVPGRGGTVADTFDVPEQSMKMGGMG